MESLKSLKLAEGTRPNSDSSVLLTGGRSMSFGKGELSTPNASVLRGALRTVEPLSAGGEASLPNDEGTSGCGCGSAGGRSKEFGTCEVVALGLAGVELL